MPVLHILTGSSPKELRDSVGSIVSAAKVDHKIHDIKHGLPQIKNGDVLLALGNGALEHMQEAGMVPKNRTIGSLREVALPYMGGTAFLSYDPRIQQRDYKCAVELTCDIRLAIRRLTTGSIHPEIGKYTYVNDFSKIIDYIEKRYAETGQRVAVTSDLETLGLDPYRENAFIVSIAFTVRPGMSHVIRFRGLDEQPYDSPPWEEENETENSAWRQLVYQQIKWLLTSKKIKMIGANFKYDLNWMWVKWKLRCTNFTFDTTLVGSILDENRSNSLNTHAKVYTTMGGYDDPFNAKYDKGRMDLVSDEDLLTYAGGDTDACYRVMDAQRKKLLEDQGLTNFYLRLLHPACRSFELVEQEGMLVDIEYYTALKQELELELKDIEARAINCIPYVIRNKYAGEEKNGKGEWVPKLRLAKATIIKDFMFGPRGLKLKPKMWTASADKPGGKGKCWDTISTSKDHLTMFKDEPKAKPFLEALEEHGSAIKTLGTYVDGFMAHLRSDGRFHPTYMTFKGVYGDATDDSGTVTGRTSAKDPAVQCLEGNALVLTSEGWLTIRSIVEGYEQGKEYIVLTHTGKGKKVIGVYRNGIKKVFTVSSEHGTMLLSTCNHPYLTDRGWLRTDQLRKGDTCYEVRPQNQELHQPDLLQLGCNEEQMSEYNEQGLSEVRWERYTTPSAMAQVREFSQRYGRKTRERMVSGEEGCERELLTRELPMGNSQDASVQQDEYQVDNSQWVDKDRSAVGVRCGYFTRETSLPSIHRDSDGYSLDEREDFSRRVFQEVKVHSIEEYGEVETFDLTIEDSHSFVANGFVVHNTIPKHTKWAKKLRRGYIAPPKFKVVNWDFSQGELRIAACIANEHKMIQLYKEGIDLHMITGGAVRGYSKEQMLELKAQADAGDKAAEKLFKEIRQGGKAGNFGLLYGMSAQGFVDYAWYTYGVKLTIKEAENFRNHFLNDLYPGLPKWHNIQKKAASLHGLVRSPLGRVRHLPLINSKDNEMRSKSERQAINSVVQSTLSDLSILSLALFHEKYGEQDTCRFFLFTHDAITAYVHEDYIEYWVPRITEIMENLPLKEYFGWEPQIPFLADCEVGDNLADLMEYDKWLKAV